MQLEQQFTIPTDIDNAWRLLNDVEGIAPCFPGAKVLAATEESVDGQVKVKLGPVLLTYAGVLRFIERDPVARRLVMEGQGVDAKGNGSASAKVQAQLSELPDGSTRCEMVTDLNVTGRPAQFGRGMMLEIGNNILGKFSNNLAAMLTAEEQGANDAGAAPPPLDTDEAARSAQAEGPADSRSDRAATAPAALGARPAPGVRKALQGEQEDSLDLLSAAGGATAKRLLPVVAGAAVVGGIIIWIVVK